MRFLILFTLLFSSALFAEVKGEGFIITITDQRIGVISPVTKRNLYSVIVENKSLSEQVGKFVLGDKILKFISLPSGKSGVVEIENKSKNDIFYVPVSPASQEVPLIFGKKAYEIPPKE